LVRETVDTGKTAVLHRCAILVEPVLDVRELVPVAIEIDAGNRMVVAAYFVFVHHAAVLLKKMP